jgi:Uma2 family endonuclease
MGVINLQTQPEQAIMKTIASADIPLLVHGDRLTRAEFEQRYEAMPGLKKAELINGKVYMPSPVRTKCHGEPHNMVNVWLGVYSGFTPGVHASDNATVRLEGDYEPQPDVLLYIDESAGGQSFIGADEYIEGAPELAAEIASSSAPFDRDEKKDTYRRNGVQEYLVWETNGREVNWFKLEAGQYAPLSPDDDGLLRSRVFPGLWLDVEALLRGDLATLLSVLQRGLASPEHGAFVERLRETAS